MAELKVDLDISTKKAEKGTTKSLKSAGVAGGAAFASGFKSNLGSIAAALGGILAFRKINSIIKQSIRLSSIQEDAVNELNTALKATGAFSEAASKDIQNFASELQKVSTIGDEATLSTAALIQSLGALPIDKLKEATQAAADLSAGLGIDLRSAALLVGKAAAGEVSSFSRYGLIIKKASDNTTTFNNTLTALNERFGGAAESKLKTFSGAVEALGNSYGDLLESLGDIVTKSPSFIAVINTTTTLITKLTESLSGVSANDPFAELLSGVITFGRGVSLLIAPFEVFFNVLKLGFSGLRSFIAQTFNGIVFAFQNSVAPLLEKFSQFPGKVGQQFRKLTEELKAFQAAVSETAQEESINTFENLAELFQTSNLDEQFQNLLSNYQAAIEKAREFKNETTDSFKSAGKEISKTANAVGASLNNTLGNAVANGIESITKSLIAGENVFKAFGQAALGLVADFAIQAGKLFVATGIAQLALFSSPGASIAAGAALIAAGTLAKSFFGGERGGDASAPAGVSGGGPLPTQPEFVSATPEERAEPETRVSVTIQGDVLDSEESSLRIVQLLEKASFDNNVKVIGGLA